VARTLLSASRRSPRKISSSNAPGQFLRFSDRQARSLLAGGLPPGEGARSTPWLTRFAGPFGFAPGGLGKSRLYGACAALAGRSRFLAGPRRLRLRGAENSNGIRGFQCAGNPRPTRLWAMEPGRGTLFNIRRKRLTDQAACRLYGCSQDTLTFRFRVTTVGLQLKRSHSVT